MNILKLLTPQNLEQEKDKFFSNKNYEPVFKYVWEKEELHNDMEDQRKIDLFEAVIGQDLKKISAAAAQYFEVDLEKEHDNALYDLERKYLPVERFDLRDLIKAYEGAFEYFGLNHKIVVNDEPGYGIRPQHNQQTLFISRAYSYQYMDIEGSVKHEMAHVIRYENGKFNQLKRSSDYLPTEEGLATFVQDYTPVIHSSLFQHAAEYEASRVGSKGSLRDIFEHFISLGFDSDLAWQRAARHKFGFKDTKHSGDIMKPAMYYFNARKLLALNRGELLKLFRGKISLSQALAAKEYQGRFEMEKIVEFFELNNL